MKKDLVLYIHGKGGNISEAEHYKNLFSECDVIGFDYKSSTPWGFIEEIKPVIDKILQNYKEIILIANGIGVFFAMNTFSEKQIKKAFFYISNCKYGEVNC